MKVQFIDIGRNKYNGIIECADASDVIKEAKKHLFSDFIDLILIGDNEYAVVAGVRKVGTCKVLTNE